MVKELYEAPAMEVIRFQNEDIVTASGDIETVEM